MTVLSGSEMIGSAVDWPASGRPGRDDSPSLFGRARIAPVTCRATIQVFVPFRVIRRRTRLVTSLCEYSNIDSPIVLSRVPAPARAHAALAPFPPNAAPPRV